MSLHDRLKTPHVRSGVKALITPPPKRQIQPTLRAARVSANASLTGTAFDIALRAGLAARGWVSGRDEALHPVVQARLDDEQRAVALDVNQKAFATLAAVRPGEPLTRAQAGACCDLARLDLVLRARRTDEVGLPARDDEVDDVRGLYGVVPWAAFEPAHLLVDNPTFGDGSVGVGGADADLYLDGAIIDIKTVAESTRSAAFLYQIVSYAALANAHGIDGAPDRARVDRVGLYFSRYALLESWPLRDLISEEAEARLLALLLDAGGAPGG